MDWEAESKKWLAKPAWTDVTITVCPDEKTETADMLLSTFDGLDEYSSTLPSGTPIHKRWRRLQGGQWWLGEYTKSDDPEYMNIVWRQICVRLKSADKAVLATAAAINAFKTVEALSA